MLTPKLYRALTLGTLALTVVLIIVGGATRVYDAGMACPDWPHCYGLWWPWPETRVIAAGHPEGYVVAGQHYVWWQVLLEWGHRGLAALVGFGLLGLVATAYMQPKRLWVPLGLAVVLLAVQIKLGAVTVWMSNESWSVVIHLGNAMLFASSLFWLWWRQREPQPATPVRFALWVRIFAFAMPLLVWVTMLIGAAVSSNHWGGICGGLMSCAGVWMPSPKVDIGQHIHMQHRLYALLVFVASVVWVIVAKRKFTAHQPLRDAALQFHLMVLGQVALGILTLYSFAHYPAFYYPLSVAHLGWGTLLLLAAWALPLTLYSIGTAPKKTTKPKRKKA